jgi:predicted DCC family thiol-disulfide oxidoreductase YuxK
MQHAALCRFALNFEISKFRNLKSLPHTPANPITMDVLRVYTDGSCDFCWWARSLVEPYDTHHLVDFRDFNVPAIAAETPYSREQLLREMHVLTPDGRWHSGFWGWVALLRVLPRRRRLAQLLTLPPFRWLGPLAYKFIAYNRYRIPKWFLRLLGAPAPCNESCSIPQQTTPPRV